MVEPSLHHPQLLDNINSQYSISNGLFFLMFDTTTTRAEIGRSWATISQDIDVAEAQELDRQNRQLRNKFILLKSYPRLLLEVLVVLWFLRLVKTLVKVTFVEV